MRQPARFRNHYRKTISPQQRRNRLLLYATLALLAIGGNRWVAGCTRVELPQKFEQPGVLAAVGYEET